MVSLNENEQPQDLNKFQAVEAAMTQTIEDQFE